MVNKEHYLTVTEANQNISKAEMMAKRKKPKAMPVNPVIGMTDDEKIDFLWHAGFSTNTGLLLRN